MTATTPQPGEPEHNERCCMNGAWPGWGPHPDCPGVYDRAAELVRIEREMDDAFAGRGAATETPGE